MIGTNKESIERLYLDKNEQEQIYIDTSPLPQHQIDGIRFLFRQFKKKKPGVILNNPEGYGKSVQVALFLNAIRKLLKQPVLILCKDDKEINRWILTLKFWTQYKTEDIAIDSGNVFERKTIFLKRAVDLIMYERRDWDVMVVKSDFTPKDLMRVNFNVGFKVWLTTIDMRKDLQMLNAIYCWMYSKKKFYVQNLLDTETQCMGPLDKLKMLDAFLEDVVIMRNDFPNPYKVRHQSHLPKFTMASRKNKDATGTKIKRSKNRTENTEQPQAVENERNNANTCSITDSQTSNDTNDTNKSIEDFILGSANAVKTEERGMDIEAFIRDKDPVICKEYELINTAECSDRNEINSEDISFAAAAQDIVDNENEFSENSQKDSENILTNFNMFEEFKATDEVTETAVTKEVANDINLNLINSKTNHNGDKETVAVETIINESVVHKDVNKDDAGICKSQDTVKYELDGTQNTSINEKKHKNKSDIDEKILEMEERALKKFKDSNSRHFTSPFLDHERCKMLETSGN